MSERDQLALPDVEAALRLVTGTDTHPRDPEPLLAGLARLAGADAWAWVLQRLESEILETSYYAMLDGGWQDERQRVSWIDSSLSPEIRTLLETMASHLDRHATFTRSQLIDDSQWYASAFYRKYREPVGLDDLLWSFVPVAPGVQSALRLHRAAGKPPFGARERDLVHVVMSAVDWLHRSALPDGARPLLVGLSRREREVLALLLAGHSKKQIAAHLRISEHTVRDYAKAIHRHFEVHSRGELFARFLPHAPLIPTGEGSHSADPIGGRARASEQASRRPRGRTAVGA